MLEVDKPNRVMHFEQLDEHHGMLEVMILFEKVIDFRNHFSCRYRDRQMLQQFSIVSSVYFVIDLFVVISNHVLTFVEYLYITHFSTHYPIEYSVRWKEKMSKRKTNNDENDLIR